MSELDWIYQERSTEDLLGLEGTVQSDLIPLAFEYGIELKAQRIGRAKLTEPEIAVLAVVALEREVNNGGYDQFFTNEMQHGPVTVAALDRIGCHRTASLTQRAIDALGIKPPVTVTAIEQIIYEVDPVRTKRLNECDNEFYGTAGCLGEPLFDFIKANKNSIRLP